VGARIGVLDRIRIPSGNDNFVSVENIHRAVSIINVIWYKWQQRCGLSLPVLQKLVKQL